MRYATITEPISAGAPCGPDLAAQGDPEFSQFLALLTATLDVRSFFDIDRKAIDVRGHVAKIGEFLQETKDLRLLSLEARIQAVAGNLKAFSESIQAIDMLLKEHWESVHPSSPEDDFAERAGAIGMLEDPRTTVMPLQYAVLCRDNRAGPIYLRYELFASGAARPKEDESVLDAGALQTALASSDNRDALLESRATALELIASLKSIYNIFLAAAGPATAPNFDKIVDVLSKIVLLIEQHQTIPDQPGEIVPEGAEPTDGAPAGGDEAAASGQPAPASVSAAPPVGDIASLADAKSAMKAVVDYFATREPSNPALLLTHQAADLIGRPLIEALTALMPDAIEQTKIRLGDGSELQLDIARLRELTEKIAGEALPETADVEPRIYSANSRAEVLALMKTVETYFRAAEPSSPVPMLLAKARGFTGQEFKSILAELLRE
ncbi:type VI secretion protein ImpA [Hartmannibacter diazotrophicus]|uniref:Type VI secretion protein ImpA n=1 Tax=Hartmannibacter diazotrophicus TaxID=1482074 RepID=A0A2C9D6F2_9HYPH|nr:type VI secretion system ImpA family N-terminal domain-containing protein [Hartmannibacter diazotrophicus]SON55876.1 type VI secretion protein ImpA [Hartmannibacter diazotrophicus]